MSEPDFEGESEPDSELMLKLEILALKSENELLRGKLAASQARLPEGMKRCTIVFKSCDLGHGWLTALNWVQHGCPTCERNALLDRLAKIRSACDGIAP